MRKITPLPPQASMTKRLPSIFLVGLLLSGCAREAERSENVGRQFTVDTLFTKDDCTVYRFYDAGYYRYFTNCSGTTAYGHSEQSGKIQHFIPDGVQGGRQ